MTAIEHKELKGITVKNIIVTIISTASMVSSVVGVYYNLKDDIHELRSSQTTAYKIDDLRLKALESEVYILQQQVQSIKLNNR